MTRSRFSRAREQGRSLWEMMIVLILVGVLIYLVVDSLGITLKANQQRQARDEISHQLTSLERLLQEDLANAARGTRAAAKGARLLCRDSNAAPRPSAFIGDQGQTLTILQTTPDEVGVVTATAPDKLIVTDVDDGLWTSLEAGSAVVVFSETGDPALWRLSASPRRATPTDFPPPTVPTEYIPERAIVLAGAPSSACGVARSVGSVVAVGAYVTPLQAVIVYHTDKAAGLVRTELTNCETEPKPENWMPVAPLATIPTRFRYLTDDGPADALPADLKKLRGVQGVFEFDGPFLKQNYIRPIDVNVREWRSA